MLSQKPVGNVLTSYSVRINKHGTNSQVSSYPTKCFDSGSENPRFLGFGFALFIQHLPLLSVVYTPAARPPLQGGDTNLRPFCNSVNPPRCAPAIHLGERRLWVGEVAERGEKQTAPLFLRPCMEVDILGMLGTYAKAVKHFHGSYLS